MWIEVTSSIAGQAGSKILLCLSYLEVIHALPESRAPARTRLVTREGGDEPTHYDVQESYEDIRAAIGPMVPGQVRVEHKPKSIEDLGIRQ